VSDRLSRPHVVRFIMNNTAIFHKIIIIIIIIIIIVNLDFLVTLTSNFEGLGDQF